MGWSCSLLLSCLRLIALSYGFRSDALKRRDFEEPAPFSFSPSFEWNGNDGSWSTYTVRVGTPPQSFRVLPSTASNALLIPIPEGCTIYDPADCGSQRGAYPVSGKPSSGFQYNASTTWSNNDVYQLPLEAELNYTNGALFGYDVVGLGANNSTAIQLDHQVVGGIATKDFYLGVFGLAPEPSNFSTFSDPQPSYMTSLKESKKIPSMSYGYTAGAKYSNGGVPGNLVLGGYDQSRFKPGGYTFSFEAKDKRPLEVGVQSIVGTNTLAGVASLLSEGIFSLLDSTLPYIWLPKPACDMFEMAFGLTYDPSTELYIVNDTIHDRLKALNPSITFKLGNTLVAGDYINILLPYAAFDLRATYPIYENATNYFPIRRAENDTQYVIGRAFFQEAYLITDYERQNFTISQAILQANYQEHIIAISPTDAPKPDSTSTNSFPRGAIAGIVIGVILIFLVIALFFWLKRRKRTRRAKDEAIVAQVQPPMSPTFEKTEMSSDQVPAGFQLPSERLELEGTPLSQPFEMQGDVQEVFELETPVEERAPRPSTFDPISTAEEQASRPSSLVPVSPVTERASRTSAFVPISPVSEQASRPSSFVPISPIEARPSRLSTVVPMSPVEERASSR